MTNHSEFYFPSSDGKTSIHAEVWLPEGEIRAVLQIAHGVSEYVGRYAPFAEFLNANGIAVIGNDHLGHGRSLIEGEPMIYFGERDGWKHVVDDVHKLRLIGAEKFPGVPYFLMGHSMGSFITRTYLIRYPGETDGAIIMGTGQQGAALISGGKFVAKMVGRKNFNKTNATVSNLAFGSYNKAFAPQRTAFDWLSVNEENVDKYIADPLCGGEATVGLFSEMLGGLSFIRKQENVNKMDVKKPVLFISGDKDPVGDFGKGVRAAHETFKKAGVFDLSLKLYPGLRHEILNEREKQQVYDYILEWIEKRI